MIRVEHLTKDFGEVRAIDDLSFEVAQGEILGFLGPNGAGKTTTMRILTCFFPPTSGNASIAGFNVLTEPLAVRRVIGYLPEGVPLYRELCVTDALDFVAHAKGFSRTERKKYVDAAIEETGLGEVRNRLIGHLSKGFRQRLGLAQAIIGEPKVLILDEPTSGLDPKQITEIRALIRAMAGRRTVILSTHILPEVQMTCTRVLIINRGRIAASGTTEHLTTRMRGGSQTEVTVAGPAREVRAALEVAPGVTRVELRSGPDCLDGSSNDSDPARVLTFLVSSNYSPAVTHPAIAETIVSKGWRLLEMRGLGLSLEDIFLKVVAGEAGEQPATDTATVEGGP
ncbi:MAG: ABC transporter ATP-binding protein [Candidatus Sumerlaeaceae bacterium]|nr:ABC transporter ATP-binding protein [Candidatus Sumerlaeaceae bacterium]